MIDYLDHIIDSCSEENLPYILSTMTNKELQKIVLKMMDRNRQLKDMYNRLYDEKVGVGYE